MIAVRIQKKLNGPDGEMPVNFDLNLEKGQFTILYGPSGAGKTSTLRMLAGLMRPDTGNITANGEIWFDSEQGIHLSPRRRNVGFVFQDYALFPNMTVLANLQYAASKEHLDSIPELLDLMELGQLGHIKPKMLSGGQQQRVALARALVQGPELLLLDEPLSALDSTTRLRLQDYLLAVHQKFGLTTLMVSHDVAEIQKLANHVVVLQNGRITNQGPPELLFSGHTEILGEVIKVQDNGDTLKIVLRTQEHDLEVHLPKGSGKGILPGQTMQLKTQVKK